MEKKNYTYKIKKEDVNIFIAEWLNEENENYPTYVRSIKLFVEYLKNRK